MKDKKQYKNELEEAEANLFRVPISLCLCKQRHSFPFGKRKITLEWRIYDLRGQRFFHSLFEGRNEKRSRDGFPASTVPQLPRTLLWGIMEEAHLSAVDDTITHHFFLVFWLIQSVFHNVP